MAGNLFSGLPAHTETAEQFETLLAKPGLRIERIVSTGQASPPGFWYEQSDAEWVLLLKGSAGIRYADEAAVRALQPGDWLHIAPRRRHRVEWTAKDEATVWLALHFADDSPPNQAP
ncbi:MAG: cupin [Gammaproteobacteria bacterium]|nr:cupin [Rhodocyclaceae bacterium]MBU3908696.1 cupin [Gammaproteobacteria bacterium]MBU4004724.1 cupin [Gammaproteobacteria bacterium]MBU4021327.1 cupin [Gammaproteobacteria bacterium]MBU4096344.1 cupin [Gammaproteobacteria bacterium]